MGSMELNATAEDESRAGLTGFFSGGESSTACHQRELPSVTTYKHVDGSLMTVLLCDVYHSLGCLLAARVGIDLGLSGLDPGRRVDRVISSPGSLIDQRVQPISASCIGGIPTNRRVTPGEPTRLSGFFSC